MLYRKIYETVLRIISHAVSECKHNTQRSFVKIRPLCDNEFVIELGSKRNIRYYMFRCKEI